MRAGKSFVLMKWLEMFSPVLFSVEKRTKKDFQHFHSGIVESCKKFLVSPFYKKGTKKPFPPKAVASGRSSWIFILVLILAGCGGNPPAATAPATTIPQVTPEAPEGFVADLSGIVTRTLAGPGHYQCSEPGEITVGGEQVTTPGFQEIAVDAAGQNLIVFTLPRNLGPGSYSLSGAADAVAGADVTAAALLDGTALYEQVISGELTLEKVIRAPGDRLEGSFSFAANGPDNATLIVQGSFQFTPAEGSSFCAVVASES